MDQGIVQHLDFDHQHFKDWTTQTPADVIFTFLDHPTMPAALLHSRIQCYLNSPKSTKRKSYIRLWYMIYIISYVHKICGYDLCHWHVHQTIKIFMMWFRKSVKIIYVLITSDAILLSETLRAVTAQLQSLLQLFNTAFNFRLYCKSVYSAFCFFWPKSDALC